MAHGNYRCRSCFRRGHSEENCPERHEGQVLDAEAFRIRSDANMRVKVDDDLWLQEQAVLNERIRRECDDILRLEELVGHKKLEDESRLAGLEYLKFGVADVESDEVRTERATKAAEALILRMQRGEL